MYPGVGTFSSNSTCTDFLRENQLFAPVEKEVWQGSRLQSALLGYRAVCHEYYLKHASVEAMRSIREATGDLHTEELAAYQFGASRAAKELSSIRKQYGNVIMGHNLAELSYYVVELAQTPEIVCSSATQTTHDFRGLRVADFSDWNKQSSWITFALIATTGGGAIVFTWLQDEEGLNERAIRTLDELSDVQLSHAVIRFAFEFCENSFFTPTWWDGIDPNVKASLSERRLRGLPPNWEHPSACLAEDGLRMVDWKVTSRKLCFGVGGQAFKLT